MRPFGIPDDLVGEVARGVEDVVGALERDEAILQERRVDRLGHHAEELDRLLGGDADEIEEAVDAMRPEDVARLVLGGRHPLDRMAREDLPHQLRLRHLHQKRVFDRLVDLEGVAEPHELVGQPGALGERLVDELRRDDGVRLLDGVGGGEVVVLAGVDDDAGARDHAAREVLIAQRAPRD